MPAPHANPLIKTIPNALSVLRIALACVFPALPAHGRLPAIVIGGLSDWIDGLVARRYHATTSTGALLDAVADKLFTLSVLITLLLAHEVMWWQALLILARDVVVGTISAYALTIGRHDTFWHMRPRLPGKLTTTLVFLWLVALLAGAPLMLDWPLFVLAAAASALAGADYYIAFLNRPAEFRGRRGAERREI